MITTEKLKLLQRYCLTPNPRSCLTALLRLRFRAFLPKLGSKSGLGTAFRRPVCPISTAERRVTRWFLDPRIRLSVLGSGFLTVLPAGVHSTPCLAPLIYNESLFRGLLKSLSPPTFWKDIARCTHPQAYFMNSFTLQKIYFFNACYVLCGNPAGNQADVISVFHLVQKTDDKQANK